MAMVMGQPYKHYCRICKKGFGCGRALGGHMRAHGINDDHAVADDPDEDPSASGEWDDKPNPPAGPKRMYALRTNRSRLKTCRVCDNCGEEFFSWKSFLDHGKCSSEDEVDDSMLSSPRSDGGGWSKGKRSRRAKVLSSEEEDLANCLVMLSAARVDPMAVVETEESSASDDRRPTIERAKAPVPSVVPKGMFECKACKKVFSSHQALGGHRASHKKVKGCFAARIDDLDEPPPDDEVAVEMTMAIVPYDRPPPPAIAPVKKASKVHECSICHRVFASGQALGGHKRCHWLTSNSPDPGSMAKFHPMPDDSGNHQHQLTLGPMFEPPEPLDLNLPAPVINCIAGVRPLRLEVPAAIYLQPWIDQSDSKKNNEIIKSNNNNEGSSTNVDDEVDSKIKLAKLSELKDMKMGGGSSPWLQVGIGSPSNEGGDP